MSGPSLTVRAGSCRRMSTRAPGPLKSILTRAGRYPSPTVTGSEPHEGRDPAQTQAAPELHPREARQRARETSRRAPPEGMVPARERRRTKLERGTMRLIATGGIIGIAVVLGAVLVGQDVAGWIVGLVIGLTTVVLAALLWSSRQL
jgi:hypothetical protein